MTCGGRQTESGSLTSALSCVFQLWFNGHDRFGRKRKHVPQPFERSHVKLVLAHDFFDELHFLVFVPFPFGAKFKALGHNNSALCFGLPSGSRSRSDRKRRLNLFNNRWSSGEPQVASFQGNPLPSATCAVGMSRISLALMTILQDSLRALFGQAAWALGWRPRANRSARTRLRPNSRHRHRGVCKRRRLRARGTGRPPELPRG